MTIDDLLFDDEKTAAFRSRAREEGLMSAAMNAETGTPQFEGLRKRLLAVHREFANALHLDPNGA